MPRDPDLFDKLFKLDKGRDAAPRDRRPDAAASEDPREQVERRPGPTRCHASTQTDIADGKGRGGQEVAAVRDSLLGDPEEQEPRKEDPQATENSPSIMSFFKTLVSPNKTEAKKDLEEPGADKLPGTSADLKSDKVNSAPQETQAAAKNPVATDMAKDGTKEKGATTPLPLTKLFWKKSVKEESVPTGAAENEVCESPVEVIKSEEVESALQTVDLGEEGDTAPKPTEVKSKREERKPPKTSILAFFRQMSVKGDGGSTHSEDINGKDSNIQTSNSTEKATTPSEPEPPVATPKGRENCSKDKKAAAEANKKSNKQEAKEVQCEPAAVEVNSLQNGDRAPKRPEKRRQSLGGFLKGLGPKRMLDAQVQTDPVSIGPAGRSK